jgi:hypothetical protein
MPEELAGQTMILQIVDMTIFTEQDMKKNIKARIFLSDGVSRLTSMIADKTFNQIVSKFSANFLLEF